MNNLTVLKDGQASPEAQQILDDIKKKFGKVPNIFSAAAHSKTALKALLTYKEILSQGEFSSKEIEAIDLAISEENECDYCLAAHTAIAKMQGFTEEETLQLRAASISDKKLKALTLLSRNIVSTKGRPDQELIADFFEVGYSKGALVELIAAVSKNIFTNYFNHIADTEIDFPKAKELVQD